MRRLLLSAGLLSAGLLACALHLSACASPPPPKPVSVKTEAPEPDRIIPLAPGSPGYERAVQADQTVQTYTRQVEATFNQNMQPLTLCYLKALKFSPGLRGSLTVRFKVKAGGKLEAPPEFTHNTLNSAKANACISDLLQSIAWPEPFNGDEASVSRSFSFGER